VTMLQLVQANWYARQEVAGETIVKFRILRDGRLTEIELEKSSGYAALDLMAQRALFNTQRLPPLPAAFPEAHLTVHLRFPYQR
jgi:TonB family protein